MNLFHQIPQQIPNFVPEKRANGDLILRGPLLWLLRTCWLLIVAFELCYMIRNLIDLFPRYHTACNDAIARSCTYSFQLTEKQLPALLHNGFTLDGYAIYAFVCLLLQTLPSLSVGIALFWLRSDRLFALFSSLWLVTSAVSVDAAPNMVGDFLAFFEWPAMFLIFSLVPNGRFVPRWSWFFPAFFIAYFASTAGIQTFLPPSSTLYQVSAQVGDTPVVLALVGVLAAQIFRYFAVASPLERQQIKWFMSGFAILILLPLDVLPSLIPALAHADSWYQLTKPAANVLQFAFIPIGIAIALFRYRLWDVGVIINRALVYGSLTLILALIYWGLVFSGQAVLTRLIGQSEDVMIVASTLVVAVLFQPLRRRVQATIDKRFYRRKYDATRIVNNFGATLHNEVDLEYLCHNLVSVVQETMQPTHVSLWLCLPQEKG